MPSSFQLDLKNFREKSEDRIRTAFHKIALDIDRSVVLLTRVDTGRARGGWNAGINNVNLSETEEDKTGQDTISEAQSVIQQAKNGDVIFISNNVEYIVHLNDGTDKTSGDFMIEKTLRRLPAIVRESVSASKAEHP